MALPPRSEVAIAETWDAESVYESTQEWEQERAALVDALERMAEFAGTLGSGGARLAAWLALKDELGRRIEKLYFYAGMSQAVDTADQAAGAMVGQAASLYSQYMAAGSFAEPEILALGEAGVRAMLAEAPSCRRTGTGSTICCDRRRMCVRRGGGSTGAGERAVCGGGQHGPGADERGYAIYAGAEQRGRGS